MMMATAAAPMASDEPPQQTTLTDLALKYIDAWKRGPQDPTAEADLRALLADDVCFHPDGVVMRGGAAGEGGSDAGPDAIIEAMRRAHTARRHVVYEPVAAAESRGCAFVAVAYELDEGGEHGVSRGLAIKEFVFDDANKVKTTRLARQLTRAELRALPGAATAAAAAAHEQEDQQQQQQQQQAPHHEHPERERHAPCSPADLFSDVVPRLRAARAAAGGGLGPPQPREPLSSDLARRAAKMAAALEQWDAAWSSGGPSAEALGAACAPGLRVLDALGLARGGGGAHCGLRDARAMVGGLRRDARSETTVLHLAVNPAAGVGFSRWEAAAVDKKDASHQTQLGGLDMALFDDSGRINTLVQFTRRAYPQLTAAAAPAGSA